MTNALWLIKKDPDIFNGNSNMRHWILIVFWQEYFVGSGQLKDAIISHLTWLVYLHDLVKTGNTDITPFHLNVVCCFADKHTEHIRIITWS